MNRPPEPNHVAPLPQRRDTANHRQADLYDYNMETEGARIHVEAAAADIGGQRGEKKNDPMHRARPT